MEAVRENGSVVDPGGHVTSLAGFAGTPPPIPWRSQTNANCFQVCTCSLPRYTGLLVDAPQGLF